MRLAGIEKGGFYPFPPHMAGSVATLRASWFIPLLAGPRGRILDPCTGEGEIANILGRLLNCKTWGCELFPYRVEKAAARIDKCQSAAPLISSDPFRIKSAKWREFTRKIR